ncbi:elongation factor P [Candidatus Wolfebacteria bacterium]|nr:elongation factor P [Candidatus Wolfebacteria bacterium]
MLSYNEIKPKTFIVLNGEPYEVLSAHVFGKQQRRPVNQTKLRNLKTGKVVEQTFRQSETAEEADIDTTTLVYIYNTPTRGGQEGEWWFHESGDPGKRIGISENIVGTQGKFLKEKTEVDGLLFNSEIIGIRIPIKMQLAVTEAPPNVRGNTAQGGTKPVTLETGAVVNVPMFVKEGDVVEVNTETGTYTQRMIR